MSLGIRFRFDLAFRGITVTIRSSLRLLPGQYRVRLDPDRRLPVRRRNRDTTRHRLYLYLRRRGLRLHIQGNYHLAPAHLREICYSVSSQYLTVRYLILLQITSIRKTRKNLAPISQFINNKSAYLRQMQVMT